LGEILRIRPKYLKGSLSIQPSKSHAHRAIICAALAEGISIVENVVLSDDVKATLFAMKTLGLCQFDLIGTKLTLYGSNPSLSNESGSTLRFLIPLVLSLPFEKGIRFIGQGRLMSRPLDPYLELFDQKGIRYIKNDESLTVWGRFKAGRFNIAGNVSSQFITGLLFSLPLLEGDSELAITTEIESQGYIDMTISSMKAAGVVVEYDADRRTFMIKGSQKYTAQNSCLEGDYSHAAFFTVAGLFGGEIELSGLKTDTDQGDRKIIDLIKAMNGNIDHKNGSIKVSDSVGKLRGIEIDASDIPDIIPVLSVAACGCYGKTTIKNAGRLRLKECDRLSAVVTELSKLGGYVTEKNDCIYIDGRANLKGGTCNSMMDHRMAMSLAVASCLCEQPVFLEGYECVKKSAPDFWNEFRSLGGAADEWNMG
jgi:3-phosphoshikimate 1-carboxyvinyltransferase